MASSSSDSEIFLRKFHAKYAGVSSKVLLDAFTDEGFSSYELLAKLVPESDREMTVLDLACGDAPLLELLLKRYQPNLHLIGVDMSPDELELARQRLGSDRVDFRLERAQQLSLSDNSVDYILCHFAFMLMDPIREVVKEIARVLKPGGLFAAVIMGAMAQGDAWAAFVSATREIMLQENKSMPAPIGDVRTASSEGLLSLFNLNSGFEEPVTIKDVVLHIDGSVERVREFLFATYNVERLSPAGLAKLDRRTLQNLKSLQREDGSVPCSLGLRLILCKKRSAENLAV